jgi:GT2 family glycosyltransferase
MITVIVPVFNNFDLANECLRRLLVYSGENFRIVVVDDASTEGKFYESTVDKHDSRVTFIRNAKNVGFVGSVNRALELTDGEDVALVNSDVFVSDKWLEIMNQELHDSWLCGSITAMATVGSVATVRVDKKNLFDLEPSSVDKVNLWLSKQKPLRNPILPSAVGHCMLIKGSLINLIGKLDILFAPGYGEEVDFSLRANSYGFYHCMSTRVLVWHKDGASFGKKNPLKQQHELLLNQKYPGYKKFTSTYEQRDDIAQSVFLRVICRYYGIRLLIDGRPLAGGMTGTAKVIIEIQKSISENSEFSCVDILVPNGFDKEVIPVGFKSEVLFHNELEQKIHEEGKYDVVFRPSQINSYSTLEALWDWGQKIVILQLDYISYQNWSYHHSVESFREFQDSNLAALLISDGILFNSEFVYRESIKIGSNRILNDVTAVLFNGLDHVEEKPYKENRQDTVLILGASFTHKNRVYAIRLLSEVIKRHPQVKFIFIGSEPDMGGSLAQEMYLIEDLRISKNNYDLINWVSEADLKVYWNKIDLVLYPSLSEGFGLVPLEAALNGIPSLYAPFSALNYDGKNPPSFLSFQDIKEDANVLESLLFNDITRREQVAFLKALAQQFTWANSSRIATQVIVNTISSTPTIRKVHLERLFARTNQRKTIRARIIQGYTLNKIFPPGSSRRSAIKHLYRIIFN